MPIHFTLLRKNALIPTQRNKKHSWHLKRLRQLDKGLKKPNKKKSEQSKRHSELDRRQKKKQD